MLTHFENMRNLSNTDFTSSKTEFSIFNGVDLVGANFENLLLKNIHFCNSNLKNANLKNAVLKGSHLINVNLTDADISGTDFRDIIIDYDTCLKEIINNKNFIGDLDVIKTFHLIYPNFNMYSLKDEQKYLKKLMDIYTKRELNKHSQNLENGLKDLNEIFALPKYSELNNK